MLEPVIDQPMLVAENEIRILVLADLHLGIERELNLSGINIPTQTEKRLKKILDYLHRIKPDEILLLGDVKHNVPQMSFQEKREIPHFLEELSSHARVHIVPGNHDGSINSLIPKSKRIILHSSSGVVIDGTGYFHGHAWPDPSLFSCDYIVMGHNHPVIRLKDPLGYVTIEKVWIRTKCIYERVASRYGKVKWKNPTVVIMPAFNELCGGIPFNESPKEDLLGPVTSKVIDIDGAEVYLIDGTHLGRMEVIKGTCFPY
ncbi:MAG: metallophosphoesterase [Candidatus Syntropharchaeia archaeon]